MAIRTYKVTLDSKNTIAPEPVFLRQGDKTGAVVIDATLMDNGTPVSLSGLTPMFKANTADGQAVIADSTGFNIVNASGGEFTYQVPSPLGAVDGKIKIAYFSFSDSSGAQSTFNVVFVVEKAADMTQESAKDWVSNLNDIISQYNQWANDAHSSWEDFVNQNKEIIESIDPGGKVLSELIDFRHSDMLPKTFDTAKLRGDFFDNDLRDRGVNVKWFGAVCDGIIDDSKALQDTIDYCFKNDYQVMVPHDAQISIQNTVYIPNNTDTKKRCYYDFNSATFILPEDGNLFTSSSAEDLHTSIEGDGDVAGKFGMNMILKNFHVQGGGIALILVNWHFGCMVTDISMQNIKTALVGYDMYYSQFKNIATSDGANSADLTKQEDRMIFRGNNNLMTIEHCIVSDSKIGYNFDCDGYTIESIRFLNNSVESTVTGVKLTGKIFNCLFDGTYAENVQESVFDLTGSVIATGMMISNTWSSVNSWSDTAVFIKNIDYIGRNFITMEANNQFFGDKWSDSRLFSIATKGIGLNVRRPPQIISYNAPEDALSQKGIMPNGAVLDQSVVYSAGTGVDAGPIGFKNNVYARGNYSGKMTDGSGGKLVGLSIASAVGGKITLNTAMYYDDQQFLLFAFNCKKADGSNYGTRGIIIGTRYLEVNNGGLTPVESITVDHSVPGGLMKIIINNVVFKDNALVGGSGFIRLI